MPLGSLKASLEQELAQVDAKLDWITREWRQVRDRQQQLKGALDVLVLLMPLHEHGARPGEGS